MDVQKIDITKPFPTTDDVHVGVVVPVDVSNPKGSRTWRWPALSGDWSGGAIMVAKRIKGEAVGNHFHPAVPGKDPEMFLLLSGQCVFEFTDLFGNFIDHRLDASKGAVEVKVPSFVFHGVRVLSDEIIFIEQQQRSYDPNESGSTAEFQALKERLASE